MKSHATYRRKTHSPKGGKGGYIDYLKGELWLYL
nr:MAG TPA: hypothetical protein [Caudoviricetes sp.]